MSSTPAPYNRQTNFVTEAQGNANITVSQIATELDAEFDAVNTSLDATQSRLAEIQRDDGALRNGIVTSASLTTDLLNKIVTADNSYRGVWAVGTTYYVGDVVYKDLSLYYCAIQHTAANFTTELTDGDWTLVGATSSDTNDPNAYVPLTRWSLTPNGTATVFTITGTTVTNSAAYLVTVDGVLQDPASYTITTNTITFSEAPPSGTAVIVVGIGYAKGIQAGSVGTANLIDASVTTAKIADGAITTAKIAAGAVVTADLADGAVTSAKIADSSITSAKIADGTIVTADLANGAVTPAKLSTGGPNWDTSGNVGIGTSSPTAKLDVTGLVAIRSSLTTGTNLQLVNTSASGGNWTISSQGTTGSGSLVFFDETSALTRLYIEPSGRINANGNPITNCKTTAKAWAKFDMATSSIAASYNVSSITRVALGTSQINFITAMGDANYTVAANSTGTIGLVSVNAGFTPTTSSVRINCVRTDTSAAIDAAGATVTIFGN